MTGAEVNRAQALEFDVSVLGEIERSRQIGCRTMEEIAEDLNIRGIRARWDGRWHRATVARVLRRAEQFGLRPRQQAPDLAVQPSAPVPADPVPESVPEVVSGPRAPWAQRTLRRKLLMELPSGAEG